VSSEGEILMADRPLVIVVVCGLTEAMTGDELDAVTAAWVGRQSLLGRGEMLGGAGGILMPSVERASKCRSSQVPRLYGRRLLPPPPIHVGGRLCAGAGSLRSSQ